MDNEGNAVREYKYEVFGNIIGEIGDTIENPFTYTSREYDDELGMMYNRARVYTPKTGRFLSEDPIRFGSSDINFYRYAFNNPIFYIDPYGEDPGERFTAKQRIRRVDL
jgi:RHS repeat-associated protein